MPSTSTFFARAECTIRCETEDGGWVFEVVAGPTGSFGDLTLADHLPAAGSDRGVGGVERPAHRLDHGQLDQPVRVPSGREGELLVGRIPIASALGCESHNGSRSPRPATGDAPSPDVWRMASCCPSRSPRRSRCACSIRRFQLMSLLGEHFLEPVLCP